MRAYDIIAKKRDGQNLTKEEIEYFIQGYVKGFIPDYQVSAWAMAVFFRGMNDEEIAFLTKEMIKSGETIDLSEIKGIKVDKHSTGGVGDTTTLVLGPLVAAGGVPVAKMSGRGLGHTGGTIDKLEAIPGFNVELTREEFIKQVNSINLAIVGQSGNLVPADKKLYALRDVTATVNSIPLIASSVMSKKIAAGADAILLDVKVGNGAFIKDISEAKKLARVMVNIGNNFNRKTMAVISNMNQPLGEAIGNSLEVREAILTLKGQGPKDLTELCLVLASYMFVLGKKTTNFEEGYEYATEILYSGKGLLKFGEFIKAQGGDERVKENLEILPLGKFKLDIRSSYQGYVKEIDTEEIGRAAMIIGAGRAKKEDKIDLGVGILIKKKIGDKVEKDDILAEVYFNDGKKVREAVSIIENSYKFSKEKVNKPELILDIIT
ncbi:MAG: pyrimidine-nucleoside phosphorylase [Clostridia bacterium]|nr:pyrimidine-nucleoside phosphorylase [Clostridia bacterium]MDN5324081.1 pyrimidine-nucleoside phosphorylase [Clostridia bacterium]